MSLLNTDLAIVNKDADFRRVKEVVSAMELTPNSIKQISAQFRREVNYAISPCKHERGLSILPMLMTYQTEIPDGSESGLYLGIDLGGTNLRIILADLQGVKHEYVAEHEPIPEEIMGASCRKLYDFLADKLAHFLESKGLKGRELKLGYTFSFPAVMEGMKVAKLLRWTKGYHCPDGVGEDHGKLFQEAIDRRGDLNVELVCVVNDTTATLLAGAFLDNKCSVGVILATGSNAAYYQDLNQMQWFVDSHYQHQHESPTQMIINTEWAAFGDNGSLDSLRTVFDKEVDKNSQHPGEHLFEKMFSGLYYGEICRLVLHHLAERGLFLRGSGGSPKLIAKPWQIETVDVSAVNSDPIGDDYPNTRTCLEKLALLQYCSHDDLRVMNYVCRTVTYRASDAVAAALAALVRHIDQDEIVIGVDGSLYKHLPGFSQHIKENLKVFCPNHKVSLVMVEDGSGRGGALGAAIADRYWQRLENLLLSRSDAHVRIQEKEKSLVANHPLLTANENILKSVN